MLKSRPVLWCIAVVGLIVLTAGISAGVAKGGLPGPGWFVASVAGALTAAAATAAALRPVLVKVVQAGVDRSIKRSDAAREVRERLGGANAQFPRVADIRDRALRYGVQQAIPLDGGPSEGLSADLPRYLPRTVDGRIRSALTARSATGGMVIVKGNSTWGKSRSMFEAVCAVLDDWVIVAPSRASDVRDLVESGMPIERTVVWLDELIDFLTGGDPLTRDVVQRAVDRGAILVGTIWKDDFASLTHPPKRSLASRLARLEHDSGTGDDLAEGRAILTATYADLIEMPRDLDDDESVVATALATQDSRWAHALADSGELSPIQVLAAAPQLLHRYRSPDDEAGGVVLRTLVALLAMEHPQPVPEGLLRSVAQAAMPPTLELDPEHWFDDALAWARRAVRGTIAPVQTYRGGAGSDPGYIAPDLLVSAARDDGGLQDQVDLDLTLTHATAEACAAIGGFFYFRDEDDVAEPFLRRAAECGVVRAFSQYGYVLGEQKGRAAEAEEWYRKAVDAGQAGALTSLGYLLNDQEGRAADAEECWKRAAEAGDSVAAFALGHVLSHQVGRAAEAEEWYRKAADGGEPGAAFGLAYLLSGQEQRDAEAEEWYRKAIDVRDPGAVFGLGFLLARQDGRTAEAAELFRKAAGAGEPEAMFGLGYVLSWQEERAGEAEDWLQKAADAGDGGAMSMLGMLLSAQEGRIREAEGWYRKAVDAGDPAASLGLGYVLGQQEGRASEAEEWYRDAADAGEPRAMVGLGHLLIDQEGRAAEAEEWFRKAVKAGHTEALNHLGEALKRSGKYAEARSILELGIAAGDPVAMWTMGELDLLEGRREAGRTWLQNAASLGVDGAGALLVEEFGADSPPEE